MSRIETRAVCEFTRHMGEAFQPQSRQQCSCVNGPFTNPTNKKNFFRNFLELLLLMKNPMVSPGEGCKNRKVTESQRRRRVLPIWSETVGSRRGPRALVLQHLQIGLLVQWWHRGHEPTCETDKRRGKQEDRSQCLGSNQGTNSGSTKCNDSRWKYRLRQNDQIFGL